MHIGWQKLTKMECLELDLPLHLDWEGFVIGCFGFSMVLCARLIK